MDDASEVNSMYATVFSNCKGRFNEPLDVINHKLTSLSSGAGMRLNPHPWRYSLELDDTQKISQVS